MLSREYVLDCRDRSEGLDLNFEEWYGLAERKSGRFLNKWIKLDRIALSCGNIREWVNF